MLRYEKVMLDINLKHVKKEKTINTIIVKRTKLRDENSACYDYYFMMILNSKTIIAIFLM